MKLDSLTRKQEEQLISYRQEWLDLGHSTDPIDLVEVEEVVERLYGLIDQPKPTIIYCQSPWQMAMTIAAFKEIGKFEGNNLENNLLNNLLNNLENNLLNNLWNNLENNLRDNLRNNLLNNLLNNLENNLENNLLNNLENNLLNNLRDNLRNNLLNNLLNNLWNNLENNLLNNLWNNLLNNLLNNLENNLLNNLLNNLENNLRDNLRNNLENNLPEVARQEHCWWTFYGPWYLYWLAFHEFPHKYLEPMHTKEQEDQLSIWINLAKSVAGWAAYEGICFVCDRPTELHLDQNNRLHNFESPAIKYADGLEFYYIHGIHIENVSYFTEPLTIAIIDNESNIEVRRVLIQKYGQAEYLLDSESEKVHEDDFGVLYRKYLPGDAEPIMMVKVVNSTAEPDGTYKDYFLGVDPGSYGGLKTAKAAVASTWRYQDNSMVFPDPEQYIPLVET